MPKILIVEDNDENRDALERRLRRRGYEVLTACDGLQGVNRALSDSPDLILMDMNMPVLDGWEATRRIRQESSAPLPIIALTAHALSGDREKAMQAGCTDYHTKPIDFPRLMSQIEETLKGGSTAVGS